MPYELGVVLRFLRGRLKNEEKKIKGKYVTEAIMCPTKFIWSFTENIC